MCYLVKSPSFATHARRAFCSLSRETYVRFPFCVLSTRAPIWIVRASHACAHRHVAPTSTRERIARAKETADNPTPPPPSATQSQRVYSCHRRHGVANESTYTHTQHSRPCIIYLSRSVFFDYFFLLLKQLAYFATILRSTNRQYDWRAVFLVSTWQTHTHIPYTYTRELMIYTQFEKYKQ